MCNLHRSGYQTPSPNCRGCFVGRSHLVVGELAPKECLFTVGGGGGHAKLSVCYLFPNLCSSSAAVVPYFAVLSLYFRRSLARSGLIGFTYAFSQASIFFGYIITFRFGAFQVTLPQDSVAFANYEDVYRAFAAIVFAGIGIGAVSAFLPDATSAEKAAKAVFAILDRPTSIDGTSEEGEKPESFGNLKFNNVSFAYPSRSDVTVLKKFSAMVQSGEKVTLALVGASGSGKSTVLSLIERFYDPTTGQLTLGGREYKDLNVKWLRSQLALVSQEPVLFNMSIAENIRYGALFREVSDEEVISAAKSANIHSFIETLPQVSLWV